MWRTDNAVTLAFGGPWWGRALVTVALRALNLLRFSPPVASFAGLRPGVALGNPACEAEGRGNNQHSGA
jgi:hypothetical protein